MDEKVQYFSSSTPADTLASQCLAYNTFFEKKKKKKVIYYLDQMKDKLKEKIIIFQ